MSSVRSYDFGLRGQGEDKHFAFIIRPNQGSPTVLGVDVLSSNGIEVLTAAQAVARGSVPCDGVIGRFCSITVKLTTAALGAKSATFQIRVADISNPAQFDTIGPFTVTGTVQSEPTVLRTGFTAISVRSRAQAAGLSIAQYLQQEFNRIAPTSYVHSDTESDALTFDSYLNPWDPIDWRNNWSNSVFDFSGSSWDSYGSAPLYHGADSPGGVAITRCHIATAKHYPRGGGFMFHRRTGEPNWFTIVESASTPSHDILVYRIDPCLPADWAIYPILSSADNLTTADLSGVPYINNHYNKIDFIRRISITKISSIGTLIWGAYNSLIPDSMQVSASLGDSGSPSFIYFDGRLVALSTIQYAGYGGAGPFFGDANVQQELAAAISSIPPPAQP